MYASIPFSGTNVTVKIILIISPSIFINRLVKALSNPFNMVVNIPLRYINGHRKLIFANNIPDAGLLKARLQAHSPSKLYPANASNPKKTLKPPQLIMGDFILFWF